MMYYVSSIQFSEEIARVILRKGKRKMTIQTDALLITVAPSIPPVKSAGIPGLDLSPEGIAAEVVRAWNAGANIVHLHVWDENGQPTMELGAFERTIYLIREQSDIIIEGSTGGFNELTPAQRSVSLNAAGVELASLNPGSVNYETGVYINAPSDIDYWAQAMHQQGIKPDSAIFEAGMIANLCERAEKGWVQPPYLFSFVLGLQGALPASTKNLLFLSESAPKESYWTAVGYHGSDLRLATVAMGMGGHVRAGFEDNIYYRPGEQAASNAQLIERLVRIGREIGREPATPAEARKMLGIG
jgi:3-keto-5-aminohexanoate cleavage enzyme